MKTILIILPLALLLCCNKLPPKTCASVGDGYEKVIASCGNPHKTRTVDGKVEELTYTGETMIQYCFFFFENEKLTRFVCEE